MGTYEAIVKAYNVCTYACTSDCRGNHHTITVTMVLSVVRVYICTNKSGFRETRLQYRYLYLKNGFKKTAVRVYVLVD